jgi:predicted helicase
MNQSKGEAIKLIQECAQWSDFEEAVSGLSNSAKGRAFEELTRLYLSTNPLYSTKINSLWHHEEIPADVVHDLGLQHPEIGIDLLAETQDGSYWAIQCKYRQPHSSNLSYQEVSTFLSISEREKTYRKLSHRLICTSANDISYRISKSHPDKLGCITHADFACLGREEFEHIKCIINGGMYRPVARTPRSHQKEAIRSCVEYFSSSSIKRGKIIHPCGAGKSLTGFWISTALKAQMILIAVPSLALIKQTLGTWTKEAVANNLKIDWIAVCSDVSTGTLDDSLMQTTDIGIEVDTCPRVVAKFMSRSTGSIRVVITTYQSSKVISEAARMAGATFDLGIFDEAHKTVGRRDKVFAQLLCDNNIEIKRRIFMTATERLFKGDSDKVMTMDDEYQYGKTIHFMSFKQAIEERPPVLCEYKVVTTIIPSYYIRDVMASGTVIKGVGTDWSIEGDASKIAALIALSRITKRSGIKRVISFHSSIARAKEFRDMVSKIPSDDKNLVSIHAFHISGKDSIGARVEVLKKFSSIEPSMVTNARCLTEGVDIPSVDAILFADPKQSKVDIIQAAGRAMRISEGKELGYIIVPVIIEGDIESSARAAFGQIIAVLGALGIHDDRIIDEFKLAVASKMRKGRIIEIDVIEDFKTFEVEKLIREIQIMVWDRLSFAKSVIGESGFSRWMRDYTELSQKSVTNYSQAVRRISNDLVRLNMAGSTLEEIVSTADLALLRDKYFAIKEFKELDLRGKGMYSAGFAKLIEYQKEKSSGSERQLTCAANDLFAQLSLSYE